LGTLEQVGLWLHWLWPLSCLSPFGLVDNQNQRGKIHASRGWRFAGVILLTIVVVISFRFKAERNNNEYGTKLGNEELEKIKIDNAKLDDLGFITGNIYNGSEWTLQSVKLTIKVYDKQVTYKEFADAIRALQTVASSLEICP